MSGRPSRRTQRFRTPPLPQVGGLDAVRVVVRPDDVGAPVSSLLAERFPALASPEARPLAERFASGEIVDQDGEAYSADEPAVRAREIFFHRELAPEDAPPARIPVIAEDDHLLVVAKPGGMASIPRGEHVRRSALVRLRVAHSNPHLSPIHRLDKQTAGVLVFSKIPKERGAYQDLFAKRLVAKTYRARVRVDGGLGLSTIRNLKDGPLDITAPIRKDHGDMWAHIDPAGKSARTTVTLLNTVQGGGEAGQASALVELTPHTGRTHQLRIHLAHVGLPILGDELYPEPAPDPVTGERRRHEVGADGLRLTSYAMSFTDPVTGEERRFCVDDAPGEADA